jgi:CDP-glucose 4,6-dehydratase
MEGMGMNEVFWSGKRVFVTGHTGFKGSWLCLWLQQLGSNVTGYALKPPTHPNLFEVAEIGEGMSSILGDIRDSRKLLSEMQQAKPEIVIHMAAQPLVRRSYLEPSETYATNVMGTVNLLEGVRQTPSVRAVVNVTTDKCYENKEWVWGYRENEPMGGFDPYSSSKACAELVTAAYRNSFFNSENFSQHQIALASARAGNVIGGGDWAEDRLIPDVIRALTAGQPVTIRNPLAIRPWQHVLEPLSGYLLLAEKLYTNQSEFAEAWNFGPETSDTQSVHQVVQKIVTTWSRPGAWVLDGQINPHETTHLALDCTKAKTKLGWRPRWSLDRALDAVNEWYLENQNGKKVLPVMLRQISDYQNS